jgi:hypothetical protein
MLELEVVLPVLLHHVRIYSMWLECSTPAGQKLSPEPAGLPEEPKHLCLTRVLQWPKLTMA